MGNNIDNNIIDKKLAITTITAKRNNNNNDCLGTDICGFSTIQVHPTT